MLVVSAARARGFTLIELMASIAILGLLLLLGMPSFITYLRNTEIRSTSESIINGLRTASAEATRRNTRVAFTLTDANGSWLIRAISDPAVDIDCTGFAADVIQRFVASETHAGAKATVTPGGKASVCFTGLGRVWKQGTPGDHIQIIDVATINTGGEGRPLRIIVDDAAAAADPAKPRGLRMCDPDPALAALTPPDPRAC
jgi:type IV fimbrial biogenesis protein FimT